MHSNRATNEIAYTEPLSVRLQRNFEESFSFSAALPRQPVLSTGLAFFAPDMAADEQLHMIDNKVRNAADSLAYLLATCCHSYGAVGSFTRGSRTGLHQVRRAA